jgi:hypothetical protein
MPVAETSIGREFGLARSANLINQLRYVKFKSTAIVTKE